MRVPIAKAFPADTSRTARTPTAALTATPPDDPAIPTRMPPLAVTLSDLAACLGRLSAQPHPAGRKP
jgi:hypothetical protein